MTWQLRDSSRLVWRAIRDAGVGGLQPADVHALVPELRGVTLIDRLRRMSSVGYLRYHGISRHGVWRVGPNLPAGEVSALGAPSVDALDGCTPDYPAPCRPASRHFGPPPGVPTSVWHLAAMYAEQPCA